MCKLLPSTILVVNIFCRFIHSTINKNSDLGFFICYYLTFCELKCLMNLKESSRLHLLWGWFEIFLSQIKFIKLLILSNSFRPNWLNSLRSSSLSSWHFRRDFSLKIVSKYFQIRMKNKKSAEKRLFRSNLNKIPRNFVYKGGRKQI